LSNFGEAAELVKNVTNAFSLTHEMVPVCTDFGGVAALRNENLYRGGAPRVRNWLKSGGAWERRREGSARGQSKGGLERIGRGKVGETSRASNWGPELGDRLRLTL